MSVFTHSLPGYIFSNHGALIHKSCSAARSHPSDGRASHLHDNEFPTQVNRTLNHTAIINVSNTQRFMSESQIPRVIF